ncbi:MAG TPA: DUF2071 domain-containing protein [Fimbriimonadaceae bacterium]|nr:DUF2071 domain-containing protein [Fimbriimonadaceae bacterium]
MLPLDAYLRERNRQCLRPAMFQRWRDLLFLHYAIEPAAIRDRVPEPLEIDTYPDADGQEMAWIGLVPFRMEGVRPRFLPGLPGHTAFPETNVRTYVHLAGRPAVWFFSLDAASGLACRVGRGVFHLPYVHARMSVEREGRELQYASKRLSDGPGLSIQAHVAGEPAPAEPGSLEFFLLERYLLFCTDGNRWFGGNVSHPPYQSSPVDIVCSEEALVAAAGLPTQRFTHRMFVEGVDVHIGKLHRLEI